MWVWVALATIRSTGKSGSRVATLARIAERASSGMATTSQATKVVVPSDRSPSTLSRSSTVAVTGLATPAETRVCICPHRATGWSGVTLTVAAPPRSPADQPVAGAEAAATRINTTRPRLARLERLATSGKSGRSQRTIGESPEGSAC